jgi:hypothetical protein
MNILVVRVGIVICHVGSRAAICQALAYAISCNHYSKLHKELPKNY